jgi:hypothetical protein
VPRGKNNLPIGAGVAAALTVDALQPLLEKGLGPDRLCLEIAGIFRVRLTEIALLRIDDKVLRFLFPEQLGALGSIPLSSSSIAAKTATSRRLDTFNNFCEVKHATVFETVKLGSPHSCDSSVQLPIQKLMSAPILDWNQKVLGVLQVSRKGLYLSNADSDFTVQDARKLQAVAKILSHAAFLRQPEKDK